MTFKQAWLTALRSGKYSQGNCVLRGGDKFCCLGVACDIVKADLGGVWVGDEFLFGGDSYYDLPPSGLVAPLFGSVGDNFELPFNDYDGDPVCISGVNDSGSTFEQIAQTLEYFLPDTGVEIRGKL